MLVGKGKKTKKKTVRTSSATAFVRSHDTVTVPSSSAPAPVAHHLDSIDRELELELPPRPRTPRRPRPTSCRARGGTRRAAAPRSATRARPRATAETAVTSEWFRDPILLRHTCHLSGRARPSRDGHTRGRHAEWCSATILPRHAGARPRATDLFVTRSGAARPSFHDTTPALLTPAPR